MTAADLTLLPEALLLGPHPTAQPGLEFASEAVQRYVWPSAYGVMLIEVKGGVAYVNGRRVMSMTELNLEQR